MIRMTGRVTDIAMLLDDDPAPWADAIHGRHPSVGLAQFGIRYGGLGMQILRANLGRGLPIEGSIALAMCHVPELDDHRLYAYWPQTVREHSFRCICGAWRFDVTYEVIMLGHGHQTNAHSACLRSYEEHLSTVAP